MNLQLQAKQELARLAQAPLFPLLLLQEMILQLQAKQEQA